MLDTVKYFLHAAACKHLKQQQLIYSSSNNNNNIESLSLKLYFSLNDIKAPLSLRFRRSRVLVFDKQQLMVIKLLLPLFPSSSLTLGVCVCLCIKETAKRQAGTLERVAESDSLACVRVPVRLCVCLCLCMCVCFSLHGMRPISKRYCPLSNGKTCDAPRRDLNKVK